MDKDIFMLLIVAVVVLGIIALAWKSRKEKQAQNDAQAYYEMYLAYTVVMYEYFNFCPESWEAIQTYSVLTKERILQEFFKATRQDKDYTLGEHSLLMVKAILAALDERSSRMGYTAETQRRISEDFWNVKVQPPRKFGKRLFELLQVKVAGDVVIRD